MIVTGCQRSGTKTLAAIFGFYHEVQFTPFTRAVPKVPASEVSWMAVPWLSRLTQSGLTATRSVPIIHLVRDPVAVINSLQGINFWKDSGHEHYREFVYKHLRSVNQRDSSIIQSVQYWVGWNNRVSEAVRDSVPYSRLRIEDIHTTVHLNHRSRAHLTLDEILDALTGEACQEFLAMKEAYGYSII